MNLNISTNSNKYNAEYNSNPSIIKNNPTNDDQLHSNPNTQPPKEKETKDQINPNTNRGLYQKYHNANT